jgi:hypothetical protein
MYLRIYTSGFVSIDKEGKG